MRTASFRSPRVRRLSARAAAAAFASTLVTAVAAPAPALADHGRSPSARDVAAGRAAVSQREAEVAAAATSVARARAAADRLATAAEVAVESYDAARLRAHTAARDERVARLVLTDASTHVATARSRVARFAAAAYMTGGMSSVDAMLNSDGPESMLYRLGTLEVISTSQRDAVQSLDAARVYQASVAKQAHDALVRATDAAHQAASARAAAQSAVQRQTAVLHGLQQRRHELSDLLDQARRHASALERERLAAIARAQAAAAARAAAAAAAAAATPAPPPTQSAPPPSSSGGDVAGTVSASTEQQAVHYAESQIGKPYQWGAAGPDSYDCSGLVMWAYGQVGVHLDHYTGYQWNEGAHIATSALRPGDLVFFATDTNDPNTIHHVGMYIGNGDMVEAPYTGADVRISPAFRPDLIGAVRPYAR